MDAVTAVSGPGPAYAFLLAEAMIDAGGGWADAGAGVRAGGRRFAVRHPAQRVRAVPGGPAGLSVTAGGNHRRGDPRVEASGSGTVSTRRCGPVPLPAQTLAVESTLRV